MWPPASAAPPICPADFPQVWHSFVHTFIDVLHAQGPAAPRLPAAAPLEPPPHVLPAVPRLIGIGDLHGDLKKARRAFKVAGLIDEQDRWTGGSTTVVQVGDLLDRGDQELPLLYFLERLKRQAAAAGGAVHVLNGNHETMNVAGQYRYVTHGGMHSFSDWLQSHTLEAALKAKCGCEAAAAGLRQLLIPSQHPSEASQQQKQKQRHGGPGSASAAAARTAALGPGGEVTRRFLAPNPVVLQVGSTLFVHGGLLRQHVDHGLGSINREAQEWMLSGKASEKPGFLSGRNAVVWSRHYSAASTDCCDCEQLAEVLGRLPGAARMVVGHTIQEAGISSACGGKVLRIDVGLSRGCGNGSPEVLEIVDDRVVRRLTEVQLENLAPAHKNAPGKAAAPVQGQAVAVAGLAMPEAARPAAALHATQQTA